MKGVLWGLTFVVGAPAVLIWSFATLSGYAAGHQLPTQVLGAASVYTEAEPVFSQMTVAVTAADARQRIVEKYLRLNRSPLVPYARLIVETSDKYSLDYRLLVAIAQQESNLCKKIPAGSHNCWGFGIYGDKVTRFDDYAQAIDVVSRGLKKNYIDKGLDTAEEIMAKYAPPSIEKGGPWAKGVNQFLAELE